LNLGGPGLDTGERIGHRQLAVIVAVDAERRFDQPVHVGERLVNIAW
jgi:hypothetical protein